MKILILAILSCNFLSAEVAKEKRLDPVYYDNYCRKALGKQVTLSTDESARLATWKGHIKSLNAVVAIYVQFDEQLHAQAETWAIARRMPLGEAEEARFKKEMNAIHALFFKSVRSACQNFGCDPKNYKELNSEGKRAKFGSRKISGNNHQHQKVYYPTDQDSMKSLHSVVEIKEDSDTQRVLHLLRWETVTGEQIDQGTYKDRQEPLLPKTKNPLVLLGTTFKGVSTIKDYITYGKIPTYSRDSVICKSGIVSTFMGKPVKSLEELKLIYDKHYKLENLDSLSVPLKVVKNTTPFNEAEFQINIDPTNYAIISKRLKEEAERIEKERLAKLAVEKKREKLRRDMLELERLAKIKEEKTRLANLEKARMAKLAEEKKLEEARVAAHKKKQHILWQAKEEVRIAKIDHILKGYQRNTKEGALSALVTLKYLNDHQPHFLTKEQRAILSQVGYIKKDIPVESIPFWALPEVRAMRIAARALNRKVKSPLERNRENSEYYTVRLIKGELVLFKKGVKQLEVTPIDDPITFVQVLTRNNGRPAPPKIRDHYYLCNFGKMFFSGENGNGARIVQGDYIETSLPNLEAYKKAIIVQNRASKIRHIEQPRVKGRTTLLDLVGGTYVVATVGMNAVVGAHKNGLIDLSLLGDAKEADRFNTPVGQPEETLLKYTASNGVSYYLIQEFNSERKPTQSKGWRVRDSNNASISGLKGLFETSKKAIDAVEKSLRNLHKKE